MIGVGLRMMVGAPTPDPGYHLQRKHGDVVTGTLVVLCGGVLMYAAARKRCAFDKRPL